MGGTQQANKLDVLNTFNQHVATFFSRRRTLTPASPSDGLCLRLHYKYTFWMLIVGFVGVYYNWLTKDIIHCISHFNADVQQRADYVNLCLSYPFIYVDGQKTTLLYYRWLHWIMLLCSLAFVLPHKLSKVQKYDKLTKLVEALTQRLSDYSNQENNLLLGVCQYFSSVMGGQNGLFHRYFQANILCLFLNVIVFFGLDAALLGKYIDLGIVANPIIVSRDGQNLTDPLTRAFSPFADCEISDVMALTNKRDEHFGCHLTAQEFYEKLFLALWYWQIFLMVVQSIYVMFLTIFYSKTLCKLALKTFFLSDFESRKKADEATKKFDIGDWFVLYKLRSFFYYNGLNRLIIDLSNRTEMDKFEEKSKDELAKLVQIKIDGGKRYTSVPNE